MDDTLEGEVKTKSGLESKEDVNSHFKGNAKTLCIPLVQDAINEGEKCFYTGKPAVKRVLWGRSY
jgi:prolyl-tRNA synthetase